MAHVVKLKLAFMEWFFYNLVMLIKLHKIRYLSLDKALLFPRNQAICLKNSELWQASTTAKFIFCWNLAHVSCITMSTKGCSGFFLFCLDLELLIKLWKLGFSECVKTMSFLIFPNNSISKQKGRKILDTLLYSFILLYTLL